MTTPEPLPAWEMRERSRQEDRTMPVWLFESWWRDAVTGDPIRRHYVHVSKTNPALLVYTQTPEKGERDIQTPIKPGRYLTKYCSKWLSEGEIHQLVLDHAHAMARKSTLRLATAADDIAAVYAGGPASCMDGQHWDAGDDEHPCRVYAAGDLAIAYIGDTDIAAARCLVWPAKKIYGRIYPPADTPEGFALQRALEREGYIRDSPNGGAFRGARLSKIERGGGGYLMPYLDYNYGVDDNGGHWVMSQSSSDYACQSTEGYILDEPEEFCDNCGHAAYDMTSVVTCINPQGEVEEGEYWCSRCFDNRTFHCAGIGGHVSVDLPRTYIEDKGTFSQAWLASDASGAYKSAFADDWYFAADDPPVVMASDETWSTGEFKENGFTCWVTGENHPNDEMHPDWVGVHMDCEDAEIAEARIAREAGTIADPHQLEYLT